MTIDATSISDAVEDLGEFLRADGVALRVVSLGAEVELAVDFDGVDGDDCVLPPARLRDTVVAALTRRAAATAAPWASRCEGRSRPPTAGGWR